MRRTSIPSSLLPILAGAIPVEKWHTAFTEVVWAVKWSATAAKGLQPVRPLVVMARDVVVPAKSAIALFADVEREGEGTAGQTSR